MGERLYSRAQVARLRLVKRLLDQGFRPGKLLPLSFEALDSLLADVVDTSVATELRKKSALGTRHSARQRPPKASIGSQNGGGDWVIPLLKSHDTNAVRTALIQKIAQVGLLAFVLDTLPALNRSVGNAWLRGDLAVYEEHIYTEMVQSALRNALQNLGLMPMPPRVLLATVHHEMHGLGLLMVEVCLAFAGATSVSLGLQTPTTDIAEAALQKKMDVVALSFSAAYSWRQIRDCLRELRALLPAEIALWAGGAGVAGRESVTGITLMSDLRAISPAVTAWRQEHLR